MFKRKVTSLEADSRQCMRKCRRLSQKVKDPKTVRIWQDKKASKIKQWEIDQDWVSRVFGQLSYMESCDWTCKMCFKVYKKLCLRCTRCGYPCVALLAGEITRQ